MACSFIFSAFFLLPRASPSSPPVENYRSGITTIAELAYVDTRDQLIHYISFLFTRRSLRRPAFHTCHRLSSHQPALRQEEIADDVIRMAVVSEQTNSGGSADIFSIKMLLPERK